MKTEAMPSSRVQQWGMWGGAAFVVGNLLFLVNKFDEMSRHFLGRTMEDVISGQNPAIILFGQLALIIGYIAFYQVYLGRVGGGAKIALSLSSIGGIILACGHVTFITFPKLSTPPMIYGFVEVLFFVVLIGLLLMLIGLIWFGILALRQPLLSRWRWLPLVTGLMGFIGFFLFSGEEITATFLLFRTLFALGLVGLGIMLWLEKPVESGVVE